MDKYRQAIIDLDREEPHDRPKDLELLNEVIEQCEKQAKILDILKKKEVDIGWLENCKSLLDYNFNLIIDYQLTQEEYDLLKKWLEND